MSFPPSHEKKVIISDTITVKTPSSLSVKGLLGQQRDIKPRYCELVEHEGALCILVFKIKKGLFVPLVRVDIAIPISVVTSCENGTYLLQPSSKTDMVLNFTTSEARDRWLLAIRSTLVPNDNNDDARSADSKQPDSVGGSPMGSPYDRVSNSSPRPPLELPAQFTVSNEHNVISNRTRAGGLSKSLTVGEVSVGEAGPTARRKPKDTALDTITINTSDVLIPQSTLSLRSEPHLSPFFNAAAPSHAVPSTLAYREPMQLDELSVLEGVNLNDQMSPVSLNRSVGMRTVQSRLAVHSPMPPSQPLDAVRQQLSAEDRAMITSTAETYSRESAASDYHVRFDESAINDHAPQQQQQQMSSEGTAVETTSIVSTLRSEVQALSMMNDQLNDALESSESQRKDEIASAFDEIGRLQSLVHRAQLEKEDFISQHEAAFEHLHKLQEVQRSHDSVVSNLTACQERCKALEEEMLALQEHKDQRGAYEKTMHGNVRTLQDTLNKHENKIEELNSMLVSNAGKLVQQIDECQAKERKIDTLTKEVLDKDHLLATANAQIKNLETIQTAMKALQTEHQAALDRSNVQEKELQLAKLEAANYQQSEESNKLTIGRLESLVKEQQLFVTELSEQLNQERNHKQEMTESNLQHLTCLDELARLKMQKGDVEREVSRLKATIFAMENDRIHREKDFEERLGSKNAELNGKRKEIDKLTADFDHMQSEVHVLHRRIELMKEQHSKMVSDEEMIQRRLALEADTYTTQIQALRTSLNTSQQAYHDLQYKSQQIESDVRMQHRELQSKIQELEDVSQTMKQLAMEHGNRVTVLETENQSLHQSLSSERSQGHSQREQFIVKEAQMNTERKLLQDQLLDIQLRYDETLLMLRQKETLYHDNEEKRTAQLTLLEKQLKDAIARNDAVESSHSKLKEDSEQMNQLHVNERVVLEERIASLLASHDTMQNKCAESDRQLSALRTEKQRLDHQQSARIHELEATAKDLTSQLEDLKAANNSLLLSSDQMAAEKAKYESDLIVLRESLLAITGERDRFQAAHTLLATEFQHSKDTYQELLSTKDSELKALQHNSTELERSKADQIKIIKKRIESLEETLLQTGNAWKKTQEELHVANETIAKKEIELNASMLSVQKGEVQIDVLDRQCKASQVQCQQLQSEALLAASKVAKLEAQLRACQDEMLSIKHDSAEAHQAHLRTVDDLDLLKQEYKQKQESMEKLQQRVMEQADRLTSLERQLQDTQRDLQLANSKYEEQVLTTNRIKAQLQSAYDQQAEDSMTYMQKIQHLNAECVTMQEKNRKDLSALHQDLSDKDVSIAALEREVIFVTNKADDLEQMQRRNAEKMNNMVDREQAELEVLSYRKELESQRASYDGLYIKWIDLGKKQAVLEDAKALCMRTFHSIAAVLAENKQMAIETALQVDDAGLVDYLSMLETTVCTMSQDHLKAEMFLASVIDIISQADDTADSTDSDHMLIAARDKLQRLESLTMLPASSALTYVLESLYKYIHSSTAASAFELEQSAMKDKNCTTLASELFHTKEKLNQTAEELRVLVEHKAISDEKVAALKEDLAKASADAVRLASNHAQQLEASAHQLSSSYEQTLADIKTKLAAELNTVTHEAKTALQAYEQLSAQSALQEKAIQNLQQQKHVLETELAKATEASEQDQHEHAKKCKKMLADIKGLEKDAEVLKLQIHGREQTIETLLEQKVHLEEQLVQANAQLREARLGQEQSASELQALLSDLQQKHDKLSMQLRVKSQELTRAVEYQQSASKDLEDALLRLRELESSASSKTNELQAELRELRARHEKQSQLLGSKEQEGLKLANKKTTLENMLAETRSELDYANEDHKQELKSLNYELQESYQANTKLAAQLADGKVQLEELSTFKSKLEQKLIDFEAQFVEEESTLTKALHALEAKRRELQHISDKQAIVLTSKDREAIRLKEEKGYLAQQLEESMKVIAANEQEHSQAWNELQSSHRDLKQKYDKSVSQVALRGQEVQTLAAEKAALEEELSRVTSSSRQAEADLEQELHRLQLEQRDVKYKHEKCLSQLHLKEQELDKRTDEKTRLDKQLEDTLLRLRELESSASSKTNELQAELRELRARHEKQSQLLGSKEQEGLKLADERKFLSSKCDLLEQKLRVEESDRSKERYALEVELAHVKQVYEEVVGQLTKAEKDLAKVTKDKTASDRNLQASLAQFEEEEASLTKELQTLQALYRDLQLSNDKQSVALTAKEREASRLKDEKASLEKQVDALQCRLRDDEDERNKQMSALQSDNRDFKHKYEKYLAQFNAKEQEVTKLLIEKSSVDMQLADASLRLRELESSASSKANELQAELRELRARHEKQSQLLGSKEQEGLKLADERSQLRSELDKSLDKTLQQEKAYASEVTTLKAECKDLHGNVSNLEVQLDRKCREVSRLVEDKETLEHGLEESKESFIQKERKLHQEVRELRDASWKLQQQVDAYQLEHQKHAQETSHLQEQKAYLEQNVATLRAALDEKQRSLAAGMRKLQDDVLSLQQVNDKQSAALERKDMELVGLRNEVNTLQTQVKEKVANIVDLSSKLQVAEVTSSKEQREKADLEKLLRKSIGRIKQYESEAASLPSSRQQDRGSSAHAEAGRICAAVGEEVDEEEKRSLHRANSRSRARAMLDNAHRGLDSDHHKVQSAGRPMTADEALAQRIQRSVSNYPEKRRSEDTIAERKEKLLARESMLLRNSSSRLGETSATASRRENEELRAELGRRPSDYPRSKGGIDVRRYESPATMKRLGLRDLS